MLCKASKQPGMVEDERYIHWQIGRGTMQTMVQAIIPFGTSLESCLMNYAPTVHEITTPIFLSMELTSENRSLPCGPRITKASCFRSSGTHEQEQVVDQLMFMSSEPAPSPSAWCEDECLDTLF
jgi:hypothetical protein